MWATGLDSDGHHSHVASRVSACDNRDSAHLTAFVVTVEPAGEHTVTRIESITVDTSSLGNASKQGFVCHETMYHVTRLRTGRLTSMRLTGSARSDTNQR